MWKRRIAEMQTEIKIKRKRLKEHIASGKSKDERKQIFMKNNIRKKENITLRLFFIIVSVIVAFITISISYNGYRVMEEHRSQKAAREQTLAIYMNTIEATLDNFETMLVLESQPDETYKQIRYSKNRLSRYLSLEKKKEKMGEELDRYPMLDGLFVYDSRHDIYVGQTGKSVSSDKHTILKSYVNSMIMKFENSQEANTWRPVCYEGEYYLVRILNRKQIYFCAWIDPRHFMEGLRREKEDTLYFLCDGKGNVLNGPEGWNQNLMDKEKVWHEKKLYETTSYFSKQKKYAVVMLSPDGRKKEIMKQIILPVFLILLMGFLCTVIVWYFTQRFYIHPLDQILLQKELDKNQTELQFLQIQTNPHFLNNCLSLIRRMIYYDRKEEAQKAILLLGRYTRRSFQPGTMISVGEEINHVESFYQLQKMRYKNQLCLNIQIEEEIKSLKIPTMLIQTFVENGFRHQPEQAVFPTVWVIVKRKTVSSKEGHFEKQLWIHIKDNGKGFTDSVLEKLEEKQAIIDAEGMEHVGIWNVTKRLEIIYKGKASLCFYNDLGEGAQVEISIPLIHQ